MQEIFGNPYSEIDTERFSSYFGWDLDKEYKLAFLTSISKSVKYEFSDETRWFFKQNGIVETKQRSNTGKFDWDEGWKEISATHLTSSSIQREFLLHIHDINPNVEKWNEDFGIPFEKNYDEIDNLLEVKGSISMIRGCSYIEIKDAYYVDENFLTELSNRILLIRDIKYSLANKDSEEFESLCNQLTEISDVSEHFVTIRKILTKLKEKVGFNGELENGIEEISMEDFILHFTTNYPEVYVSLLGDEMSYLALVLIFLCDGAEFINKDTKHLTAGQRRVINIAHQWYEAPKGELILIDEPEVSLHVTWQRNLISALNDIHQYINEQFKTTHYENLRSFMAENGGTPYEILNLFIHGESPTRRILIATHSPDIIYHHQHLVSHIPPLGGD